MINKVAFTGRETMLTNGVEKVAEKAAQKFEIAIVKASSILEAPAKPVAKVVYTSPFASVGHVAGVQAPVVNRTGLDFFA